MYYMISKFIFHYKPVKTIHNNNNICLKAYCIYLHVKLYQNSKNHFVVKRTKQTWFLMNF